jgi:hypothetical protein
MGKITATELAGATRVLNYEEACYSKFCHYAEIAHDQSVRMLCDQLADRSREHYQAVLAQVEDSSGKSH